MTEIKHNALANENLSKGKSLALEATDRETIRQCMYKRIAQGQALMDIEDIARRQWGRG